MDGVGGTLEIFGAVAGQVSEWHLRRPALSPLTLTLSGSFARYWVQAGAETATARVQKTPPAVVGRPPRRPGKPIVLIFEGRIAALTTTGATLIDVKLIKPKGAD